MSKRQQKKSMKDHAADVAAARELATIDFTAGKSPVITSKDKAPAKQKAGVKMSPGDWVRVYKGPVRGAEGLVQSTKAISPLVTLIEIRQLNGNVIRLPRAYFEFATRPSREIAAE